MKKKLIVLLCVLTIVFGILFLKNKLFVKEPPTQRPDSVYIKGYKIDFFTEYKNVDKGLNYIHTKFSKELASVRSNYGKLSLDTLDFYKGSTYEKWEEGEISQDVFYDIFHHLGYYEGSIYNKKINSIIDEYEKTGDDTTLLYDLYYAVASYTELPYPETPKE